jgi:hypothetical protein
MVALDINRDNVILKFTSGVDLDGVSQNSRIHDIRVWGVPGGPETGIDEFELSNIKAYYVQGTGLVVEGDVEEVTLYDLNGRSLLESKQAGDQVIDLSGFVDGTYILRARDRSDRSYSKKFLKN